MTDYWLNKLMFDLQGPGGKERWAEKREETVDRYPLSPEVRRALLEDDLDVIQPLVNPYLLRFYLLINGYDDEGSIKALSDIGRRRQEAIRG